MHHAPALRTSPNLEGKLHLEWTVSASGSVQDIRVKTSNLGDADTIECVKEVLEETTFAAPSSGDVRVSTPFFFRAHGPYPHGFLELERGRHEALDVAEFEAAMEYALRTKRTGDLDAVVERMCTAEARCVDALVRMLSEPQTESRARARIEGSQKRWEELLPELLERRQRGMGSAALAERTSHLLEFMGRREEAARMLSELVEFAPHDHTRRVRYARMLASRGQPLAACKQYATALRLGPASSDVLRMMMELSRAHEGDADAIKKCITEGVSSTPFVLVRPDSGVEIPL